MLRLLFLFTLGAFSLSSYATHVMGNHIRYERLDSLKYKIYFTYYRDCRGVAFSDPSQNTSIQCSAGGSLSLDLSLESVDEITKKAGDTAVCSSSRGPVFAVERHIYSVTVDFNKAPFKALANCCELRIQTSQCCRNGAINTGPTGNFYNYAVLNLCEGENNSSPVFQNEPIQKICCNSPVELDFDFSDDDGDSLSFAWGEPLSGYGTSNGYSGGFYAFNHPFSAYYPGSLKPPFSDPNASPPVGVFLDPYTGKIVYTPTRCDEVTVAVIEVTEWRKDSNGIPQEISLSRFDFQYITETCPDSTSLYIDGPYAYDLCVGDSFELTVRGGFNYVYPDSSSTLDSLTMSYQGDISGSRFDVTNPNARVQKGIFAWRPKSSDASDSLYTFDITVEDNEGRETVRTFYLKVHDGLDITINKPVLQGCAEFSVSANAKLVSGPYNLDWELLDTLGNALSSELLFLNGTTTHSGLNPIYVANEVGEYLIVASLSSNTSCNGSDSFRISVEAQDTIQTLNVGVQLDSVGCSQYRVKLLNHDSLEDLLALWTITDSEGKAVKTSEAQFNSTSQPFSSETEDLFTILEAGDYELELEVKNRQTNCVRVMSTSLSIDSTKANMAMLVNTQIQPKGCGTWTVSYSANGGTTLETLWTLYGLNAAIDSSHMSFNSTNSLQSTLAVDQVTGFELGTYRIRVQVKRQNEQCYSEGWLDHKIIRSNRFYRTDFDLLMKDLDCGKYIVDLEGDPSEHIYLEPVSFEAVHPGSPVAFLDTTEGYFTNGTALSNTAPDTLYILEELTGRVRTTLRTPNSLCWRTMAMSFSNNSDDLHVPVPEIRRSGTVLYSVDGSDLKWFRNDTFIEEGDSIDMSVYGSYTAQKCNASGCCSQFTEEVSRTASVRDWEYGGLNIYPNPSSGVISVDLKGLSIEEVQMRDQSGRAINIELRREGDFLFIDWEGVAGVYYLSLRGQNNVYYGTVLRMP